MPVGASYQPVTRRTSSAICASAHHTTATDGYAGLAGCSGARAAVQKAHRRAPAGISLKHSGQGTVGTSGGTGPASGHEQVHRNDDEEVDHRGIADRSAIVLRATGRDNN